MIDSGARGNGSTARAFGSGNACEGSAVYTENIIWDAPAGIDVEGDDIAIANNLVIDLVQGGGVARPNGLAISTLRAASRIAVYRNVLVRPRNSFRDSGSDMDVRCNVVLDPLNENRSMGERGSNVSTQSNFFYGDGTTEELTYNLTDCNAGADGDGCPEEPDDHIFDALAASQMERLCLQTRRWTGPESNKESQASTK